jgi:ABC-2 type transport system ATP-binding protein
MTVLGMVGGGVVASSEAASGTSGSQTRPPAPSLEATGVERNAQDDLTLALRVSQLSRHFGDVVALDDVSFAIDEGRFFGLVGENGSGKTTLARLVVGLDRPTSGSVAIFGIDVARHPRAARRLVGFAGQEGVYDSLSVAEQLDFHARLIGLDRSERAEAVTSMLQLVDLHDRRRRAATSLSPGERQRLAIARALLADPPLIVLDDPWAGLDARGQDELREVLRELRQLGKTLLVTAGDAETLRDLSDEIGQLDHGVLVAAGPPSVVIAAGPREVRIQTVHGDDSARAILRRSPLVETLAETGDGAFVVHMSGDDVALAHLVGQLVAGGVGISRVVATAAAIAATGDLDFDAPESPSGAWRESGQMHPPGDRL